MHEDDKRYVRSVILGILGFFLVMSLFLGIYSVPAGHVGVITRFGAVNRVVNPGVGFKIPFVEGRKLMSAQTQKIVLETEAGSSNLQAITSIVSVNYRIIGERAADLYQEVGKNYEEVVIKPQIEQAFKSSTAQFTAERVIIEREELSNIAQELLQEELAPFYIIIQTFNIEDIQFSEEYNNSIEQKQVQEQNIEIARLRQKEAEINAETIRIEAQAEASAQEILNNTGALSNSYLKYLFLTNWDGALPRVIGGADPVFDLSNYVE